MGKSILKYLNDILGAISHIELFCTSSLIDFQSFCEDKCLKSALQWEIVVIGEAMSRILEMWPDIPITSARRMVDAQNFLLNGYDSLKEELVWSILVNHLSQLKSEVTQLLESPQEVR